MAIGDGCIYKPVDKRKLKSDFRINHSIKQEDYLKWKLKKVSEILNCNINIHYQKCNDGTGKKHGVVFFSKTHRYFAILRKYLYRNNKKDISAKVIPRLSDLGLAILYLDDGNVSYRTNCKNEKIQLEIALGVTEGNAIAIAKAIEKKWGVKFSAHKMRDTGLYRIRCGDVEARKFLDIIREPVLNEIQALQYKVLV